MFFFYRESNHSINDSDNNISKDPNKAPRESLDLSSMQSLTVNDESTDASDIITNTAEPVAINTEETPTPTATGAEVPLPTANTATSATPKAPHSIFAKLTDAKKTLFGRSNVPDPFFSSATQNKALLTYILSEPNPQLDVIKEFEQNGAQLNAITDEGNTALHLLARAELHSAEAISIVDYLAKKGGCDPNRQNDYGWTAGK